MEYERPLRVLILAAEIVPFVKVGGLADVVGALPKSLQALDHARHYLRNELARRLNLRKIPELHFEPGPGADTIERVELLLKRAKKIRRSTENQP